MNSIDLAYIFIYQGNTNQLLRNVRAVFDANQHATLFVMDITENNPDDIETILFDEIKNSVAYIKCAVRHRLYAYNVALRHATTEWVVFRNDSDSFLEANTLYLCRTHRDEDCVMSEPEATIHPEQPTLEDCVFKTKSIKQLLPLSLKNDAADRLLQRVTLNARFTTERDRTPVRIQTTKLRTLNEPDDQTNGILNSRERI